MTDNTSQGTLSVDFDEITRMFAELRPVAAQSTTPQEFIEVVQEATGKIFLKYFEFPNSRLYKPEEMGLIVGHVMDCINNITPPHISYRSVSIDGKWTLVPKEKNDSKPSVN